MNRRIFLHTATTLGAAFVATPSFPFEKWPDLSFSTLGCPDWTLDQIVEFAASRNYKGIEVRGIQRELNLPGRKEFSKGNRPATLRLMKDNNLKFACLGSSATLHFSAPAVRTKNIDEGKRFIDLAHQLTCPYVRVFPNLFPKEQEKIKTINLISDGLLTLGRYAKGSGVKVLIESHGDLVKCEDILWVLKNAEHENTGLVWDVANMWTQTKEPPAQVYEKLKKYINHTHLKDARLNNREPHYVLLGTGEVPIIEAVDILWKGGYRGFYSFEWEKLWHPEIEDPEVALAHYAEVMTKHFR